MNVELKEKWVEALRSGNYKQGTYAFTREHGAFCCLGVLCDVVDPNSWDGSTWRGSTAMFSPHQRNELGLTLEEHDVLMNLNDSRRFSFPQIASWIEANVHVS